MMMMMSMSIIIIIYLSFISGIVAVSIAIITINLILTVDIIWEGSAIKKDGFVWPIKSEDEVQWMKLRSPLKKILTTPFFVGLTNS